MKYVKKRWFEEEGGAVCARCDLCDGELRYGEKYYRTYAGDAWRISRRRSWRRMR